MDEKKGINNALGTIRIADEVVSIIAGLAATEVEGVAGMSGGIAGGIAEILGRKNFSKGVKVEVGEKEAAIDLYIIVKYGVRIPDIALNVQEAVKTAIENIGLGEAEDLVKYFDELNNDSSKYITFDTSNLTELKRFNELPELEAVSRVKNML